MTDIAAIHEFSARKRNERAPERESLALTWADVKIPLLFLLCLSAAGLLFYPAVLAIILILLNRWRNDRYDFVIMLFLTMGEYGFIDKSVTGIFLWDIGLVASVALWLMYRKPMIVKKLLVVLLVYAATMFILALMSLESMSIQILTMRQYLTVFCIIIPIVAFGSPEFDMKSFFRKTVIYGILISAFYLIDGFILCGNILVPNTTLWEEAGDSTFFDPIWRPLSFVIFRKYPPGLYVLMLAVYPMAKMFSLRIWQWCVIVGALVCSLTFTVMSGILGAYLLMRVRLRYIMFSIAGGIVALVAIYYIDGTLPVKKSDGYQESALRIKSTIDQFVDLYNAVDDEDLAMFASGRMSQILPKFDVIAREGKMWTGLGFLHRDKSKINRYIIENDYYTDIANNIEVATGVEVVPAQIIINIGYIGLIVHTLAFFLVWYFVRRLRYSGFVLSVLILEVWFGLGGFAGLISFAGLGMLSIAFAAVLACNYSEVWGSDRRRLSRTTQSAFPRYVKENE